jgi:hypothetical protein
VWRPKAPHGWRRCGASPVPPEIAVGRTPGLCSLLQKLDVATVDPDPKLTTVGRDLKDINGRSPKRQLRYSPLQVKHKSCFRNKATYLWIKPPTLPRRCSFKRKIVVEGEEHVVEQHRRERALRARVE